MIIITFKHSNHGAPAGRHSLRDFENSEGLQKEVRRSVSVTARLSPHRSATPRVASVYGHVVVGHLPCQLKSSVGWGVGCASPRTDPCGRTFGTDRTSSLSDECLLPLPTNSTGPCRSAHGAGHATARTRPLDDGDCDGRDGLSPSPRVLARIPLETRFCAIIPPVFENYSRCRAD